MTLLLAYLCSLLEETEIVNIKCPGKQRHHRKPRSRGGTNEERNITLVKPEDHQAYHKLFGNKLPQEMANMLSDTWIDPDYYLVAIKEKRNQTSD